MRHGLQAYAWVAGVIGWTAVAVSPVQGQTIEDSASYFPDEIGNTWSYRGEVSEGPLQSIEHKLFVNESKVMGSEVKDHVMVRVFHDSNGGNHGPSTSYYRRDVAGVVYYGSDPGTPLEKQLVPYQIVQFPLRLGSTFQQFDRKGLDFGTDMDQDGINERADVLGTVTVAAEERVAVPAGSYDRAVRVEARMTLRITLSSTGRTAVGTDVMSAWFVKGIGLVKYVERQELPPFRSDRGVTSEIMEELVEFKVKGQARSFDGSEAPTHRVLAHDSRDHKL